MQDLSTDDIGFIGALLGEFGREKDDCEYVEQLRKKFNVEFSRRVRKERGDRE
jgi:hypothetical protein